MKKYFILILSILSFNSFSAIKCTNLALELNSDGEEVTSNSQVVSGINKKLAFYDGPKSYKKGVLIDNGLVLSYRADRGNCFLLGCTWDRNIQGYDIAISQITPSGDLMVDEFYLESKALNKDLLIEMALDSEADRTTKILKSCRGSL